MYTTDHFYDLLGKNKLQEAQMELEFLKNNPIIQREYANCLADWFLFQRDYKPALKIKKQFLNIHFSACHGFPHHNFPAILRQCYARHLTKDFTLLSKVYIAMKKPLNHLFDRERLFPAAKDLSDISLIYHQMRNWDEAIRARVWKILIYPEISDCQLLIRLVKYANRHQDITNIVQFVNQHLD
ncbi:MAG: hypothetical protein G01um101418_700 [Parcubacteria group bacterium Gr01-1014_18]|nr:MAG: hypothetical protein Greene041636_846 [Parcubacteria group bacterium Greene0416_36]TSC80281.1 MAG: hypothetical protein G01um101418_700 [Parcubacteria group bacterium Gr01-1014_18]TSC98260.1 MAG: hypothetical protein Greene101420_853 [Parcubacteria group bacterium Greene1014_20]TSD06997.1 MAG: hypothetical protein Greene07142_454 [Parcubacteria group bacterium Greene0714_2]